MGMYVWKESFNTGVDDIDIQHRMFLDLLNECSEYSYSNNCSGVVPEMVARMKAYAEMHFAFEEHLMRSVNFVGCTQHEAQHEYFKRQVGELEAIARSGVNEKASSLAVFMRDWLINHILEEDKKYTPFLSAARATP